MIELEDYKKDLKDFWINKNQDGLFEIELSVLNYKESSDKNTIEFRLIGIKGSEAFSIDLQLKRFKVIDEDNSVEVFIPARIGIIPNSEIKFRKPFFKLLFEQENTSNLDLVDFIGVGLELNESDKYGLFSLERLFNEKFIAIANNEVSVTSKKYFEFGVEFNFPTRRVRFFETNIKYRKKIIDNYVLEVDEVNENRLLSIQPNESGKATLTKEKPKQVDSSDRLKLSFLVLGLALIIGFPIFKIIQNKIIDRKGIETEAIVIDKGKFLGGKPLKYSYFLNIKYQTNNRKLYKSKVYVDKDIYIQTGMNDTILIQYLKSKPIKALIITDE